MHLRMLAAALRWIRGTPERWGRLAPVGCRDLRDAVSRSSSVQGDGRLKPLQPAFLVSRRLTGVCEKDPTLVGRLRLANAATRVGNLTATTPA